MSKEKFKVLGKFLFPYHSHDNQLEKVNLPFGFFYNVPNLVYETSIFKSSLIAICDCHLSKIMLNLVIVHRIFFILPVSVATGERSFSKIKLIKIHLCSTISKDRLVGLATLSIEHDIAKSIDINKIIPFFPS